ncbi:hypothetical protein [Comamonas sp. MYb69]|uniref:hypothetical protein n=1 Tax=Comamonas sp. MYb69 TaxID=1848650 RepID=UPI0030B28BFD
MSEHLRQAVPSIDPQVIGAIDALAAAYKLGDKARLPDFEYVEEAKRFYFGYCAQASEPVDLIKKEIDTVNDATLKLKL